MQIEMGDAEPDFEHVLAGLDAEDIKLIEELDAYKLTHKMEYFEPYPKQLKFFAMGDTKNERCLFAGNQYGKSEAGAFEMACHLTGLYPPWWTGRRFDHPVRSWACGETTTHNRDIQQRKLFGDPGVDAAFGTGFVPREYIVGTPTRARGAVADAFDTVQVRHFTDGVEDGISTVQFKSYEQGRKKFASATLDFVWWDEEPDEDIYIEGNARWSATGGMSYMTFTPLQGMSNVTKRFYQNKSDPLVGFVLMGPKDSLHMTPEKIKAMLSKYPHYQHRARMEGLPMLGAGAIFNANEETIRFNPNFDIPLWWTKIWGIDFGITHPFAAVLCLHDRETDVFYVYKTVRVADAIPDTHAISIQRIGAGIPIAWPHDGNKRETDGKAIKYQYKKLGLKMLEEHATFPDGSIATEAAILQMQQRMADGRFRVAADCADWWEEYRMYHRDEDGKLVKKDDDLMSATMKALMMLRHAQPGPIGSGSLRPRLASTPVILSSQFDLFSGQPTQT